MVSEAKKMVRSTAALLHGGFGLMENADQHVSGTSVAHTVLIKSLTQSGLYELNTVFESFTTARRQHTRISQDTILSRYASIFARFCPP